MQLFCQNGWFGLPGAGPFDAIHVGAGAEKLPDALLDQLKVNILVTLLIFFYFYELVLGWWSTYYSSRKFYGISRSSSGRPNYVKFCIAIFQFKIIHRLIA